LVGRRKPLATLFRNHILPLPLKSLEVGLCFVTHRLIDLSDDLSVWVVSKSDLVALLEAGDVTGVLGDFQFKDLLALGGSCGRC
jgi:hypothetical protein